VGVSRSRIETARIEWEEGERRLERARRDPHNAATLDRLTTEMRRELGRRLGQTYTLAELVSIYDRSATWSREVALRAAPDAPQLHQLALIADPVFAAAARGATDWSP
jgi:hypothetical protein